MALSRSSLISIKRVAPNCEGVFLMQKPLTIRFIPGWMQRVIGYYDGDYSDFESIVSSQDLEYYKLANNLLQAKFVNLQIVDDYHFVDSKITKTHSPEECVFALFGPGKHEKKVVDFDLRNFMIFSDKHDGIYLIENPDMEDRVLLDELLEAIALYRGKSQAFNSKTFNRFLTLVK